MIDSFNECFLFQIAMAAKDQEVLENQMDVSKSLCQVLLKLESEILPGRSE
ncbi:hypothetical protein [Leptospira limi]|uniref:Uncharacterized protein n=1 Tax=Leptospira limi TaxID=2950023 RepID=A0ABT3LYZ8_9LEPT|nr:hypothetical protein [Leptospira limi]MCW7462951.1 hypothetical protein [Leptospira limi]